MSKNIQHRDHLSSYLTKHRKNPQKNEYVVHLFCVFQSAFLLPRKLSYKFLSKHVLHDKNLESKNRKRVNKLNLTVQCIIYSIKTAWEPMREELCFQGKQLFIVSRCRVDVMHIYWLDLLQCFCFCHSIDNFTPLKLILFRF